MLNFPISHAESLIEEEISSSQPICSLASSDSPADQSYPSFNGLGMSNQYGTWQDITIKNDQKIENPDGIKLFPSGNGPFEFNVMSKTTLPPPKIKE